MGWIVIVQGPLEAQPPAPDEDRVVVTKGMFPGVDGSEGSVVSNALVRVVDSNGAIATATADATGAFTVPCGHLEYDSCTYLLVSQSSDQGESWSKSAPFHSDPPLADFATSNWETVYAAFIKRSKLEGAYIDGLPVLVRPRAAGIRSRRTSSGWSILGTAGTVEAHSLVRLSSPTNPTFCAEADSTGQWSLHLPELPLGTILLVTSLRDGIPSRASAHELR